MNTVIKHQDGRRELAQLPEVGGDLYQLLNRCGCTVQLDRWGRVVLSKGDYYRWFFLLHAFLRAEERLRAIGRVNSRLAEELRDIREEMLWDGDILGWVELVNLRVNGWEDEHIARLKERDL